MPDLDRLFAAGRSQLLLAAFLLPLVLVGATEAGEGDAVDCLPDNPSFEMGPGLEGNPVSGWTDDGNVGLGDGLVSHARKALWLYGPFNGTADTSTLRCLVASSGGWSYRFRADVGHLSSDPLEGAARAFFTVRWRSPSGGVIAEEAVILLNSLDPTDIMQEVEADFGPAPPGTSSMELEFSFLQSSAQETGRVWIDNYRFDRTVPGVGQWGDFGSRRIDFGGYSWRVKNTYQGPGPNQFSDAGDVVSIQPDGAMSLGVVQSGGWRCSEVVLEDYLGYGTYRFTTRGRLDQLDPNIVFGLFIWEYVSCYESTVMWWNPPSEFDIEFSRWGDPNNSEGQFVAQPYDWPGNIYRFDLPNGPESNVVTSEFTWTPGGMICRAWLGDADTVPKSLLASWYYDGPHHPRPGRARVHLNLWLLNGQPPQNGQSASVLLDEFTFIPLEQEPPCPGDIDGDGQVGPGDLGLLIASWGSCPGSGECPADVDGNGAVNAGDLGLLVGAWGPCPE